MSLQTSGNIMMATILMLLAGAHNSVILSSQSLCAVIDSTVKIPCSTSYSSITERQWYQVQRSDGEPQDLSTNPQYSGRVSISTLWNDCTLTINNVRGSDSGVYNFRFRTQGDEWISASPGVTLTVTDLQVKVDPETVGQREVKLTCSFTCSFTTETLWSVWYWNGVFWLNSPGASIVLNSTILDNQGNFSCRISGSEHRSPTTCVCALKGSSVDLSCSYKYPGVHTVIKSFWFIKEQQVGVESVDVREEEEYQGRVKYRQSSQNDCSMTITHLRESDAHTYRFRFHTDGTGGKYTGEPGVSLSVTGSVVK
ncbi:uncharacterized protein LOC143525976 [Brachyhypopomus gauderio]|uniref:uncharacterized protein LOC143525976 n=1 Tax=Brachyhypopomus gauderio TaxID=698409 RepID=UPI00404182F4